MNSYLQQNRCILILAAFYLIISFTSCKKDYLSKSDSKALFAKPNATEIEAILTQWQQRDLIPTDYQVIQEEKLSSGAYTLKMVSYKVGPENHYAALVIPKTSERLPLQIIVGGYGLGITVNSVKLVLENPGIKPAIILGIPALRGQSLELSYEGKIYKTPTATGLHCDAFDGASDDVLSLLNLIDQNEPFADVERTGVRGGSRGGTVALLAALRDSRIKRAINVAGPTDMLTLTAFNQNDPTYQCQFLDGFKNHNISIAKTREKMIASSPLFFASRLPLVQLHLGTKDNFVPLTQGMSLKNKMLELGIDHRLELFNYDRGHGDIAAGNTEMASRIGEFVAKL